jgi:hypothetical protein
LEYRKKQTIYNKARAKADRCQQKKAKDMSNTKNIKALKYILKNNPTDLKLQKYCVASILKNNPTYRQLMKVRDIVLKHNWEVNIVDGNKKQAYIEGLKMTYYSLINDMMEEVNVGKETESLKIYMENYKLY